MKYEGLLMYALQKGTRQKTHLKKVFQNIVIFNLFHLRYYASYCIVVRTKIYYNITYHPLVVYMSLSSSFDIPGSPLNVSSGFSDVSGMNTSFGGSFGDP